MITASTRLSEKMLGEDEFKSVASGRVRVTLADADIMSSPDAEGLSDKLEEMVSEAVEDWDADCDGGTEAEPERGCDRDAVRNTIGERDSDLKRVIEEESVCAGVGVSVRVLVRDLDGDCPGNSDGSCDGDSAADVLCDGDDKALTLGWVPPCDSVADGVKPSTVTDCVGDCCRVIEMLRLPV